MLGLRSFSKDTLESSKLDVDSRVPILTRLLGDCGVEKGYPVVYSESPICVLSFSLASGRVFYFYFYTSFFARSSYCIIV